MADKWLTTDGDIEAQARTLARKDGRIEPDNIDQIRAKLQLRFQDFDRIVENFAELKEEKGAVVAMEMQVRAATRYADTSRDAINVGLNPDPTR